MHDYIQRIHQSQQPALENLTATHYKARYIKLTSLWISCLYYKKGLSAPWRFEGKAEMRWEGGRRGEKEGGVEI